MYQIVDGMKLCGGCKQQLPVACFFVNRARYSGLDDRCKPCHYKQRVEHGNNYGKQWRLRLRREMLDAYGHKCACCGETKMEFLALDHRFNDGKADRARFKNICPFYVWLKKQGFPKDRYQLLCHNCNMAKAFYGTCPHQRD